MKKTALFVLTALCAVAAFARSPAAFRNGEKGRGYASLQKAVDGIGSGEGTIIIAPGTYRQCAIQKAGVIAFRAAVPGLRDLAAAGMRRDDDGRGQPGLLVELFDQQTLGRRRRCLLPRPRNALPPRSMALVCGPVPLLQAVQVAWQRAGRAAADLRFETFGAVATEAEPFWVDLPRHGLRFLHDAIIAAHHQLLRYANRQYVRQYRLDPQRMMGLHISEVIGSANTLNAPFQDRVLLTSGEPDTPVSFTRYLERADGSRQWVNITLAAIRDEQRHPRAQVLECQMADDRNLLHAVAISAPASSGQ